MSNPDIKISSIDSLSFAFPISILFVLIIVLLFQLQYSIPYFKLYIWIGFPILTYIITSVVNIISQYINCKTINTSRAFIGGFPSLISVIIGLLISSISYCRIPIASVFSPLIIGQTTNITTNDNKLRKNINSLKNNSKECCIPKLSLEVIESKFPIITGLSYGFYIMFSILFGVVIGTGISTIC